MSTVEIAELGGLLKNEAEGKIPLGRFLVAENVYCKNTSIVSRPNRELSPFTLESPSGTIIDTFHHEGLNDHTTLLFTDQKVYNLLASNLSSSASAVDNESLNDDECKNPQFIFETDTISIGSAFIQFYLTKDVSPRNVIRAKTCSVNGNVINYDTVLSEFDHGSQDIEAIWLVQMSTTTGAFVFRLADDSLNIVPFTYDSTLVAITYGIPLEIRATGITSLIIKGAAAVDSTRIIVIWAERDISTYTMHAAGVTISNNVATLSVLSTNLNWSPTSVIMDGELINADVKKLSSTQVVVTSRSATSTHKVQIVRFIGSNQLGVPSTISFTTISFVPTPRIVIDNIDRFYVCGQSGGNLYLARCQVVGNQVQVLSENTYNNYVTDNSYTSISIRAAIKLNNYQIVLLSHANDGSFTYWDAVVFGIDASVITYLTFTHIRRSDAGIVDFTYFGLKKITETQLFNAVSDRANTEDPQGFLLNVTTTLQSLTSFATYVASVNADSFNNLVYISNVMLKTDLINVYPIGISASTVAPTVAAGSNSGVQMDGVYDYLYTYYNSTYGIESGPSPISDEIEVEVDEGVVLSNLQVSADPQIDRMRIYRRKVSAGQTLHFLVTTTAQATSITDTINDASVSQLIIAPEVDGVPPRCLYLVAHGSRMFYLNEVGTDGNHSALWYSEIDRPDIVSPESILVVAGGGQIRGGIEFFDNLYIFKDRSIWILAGDSIDTFELVEVVPDVGALNHRCIIKIENVIFCADEQGVHAFNGQGADLVSEDINDIWKGLQGYKLQQAYMAHDVYNHLLLVLVPYTSNTNFDTVLCYNYRKNKWSVWPLTDLTTIATVVDIDEKYKVMFSKINRFGFFNEDADDDLGSSFEWKLQTGFLNLNELKGINFVRGVNWQFDDAVTCTAGYYFNTDKDTLYSTQLGALDIQYQPILERASKLALYLSGTWSMALEGASIEGENYSWR